MDKTALVPLLDALMQVTEEQRNKLDQELSALTIVKNMFMHFENPRIKTITKKEAVVKSTPTRKILKKKLKKRSRASDGKEMICAKSNCGKPFLRTSNVQKYCPDCSPRITKATKKQQRKPIKQEKITDDHEARTGEQPGNIDRPTESESREPVDEPIRQCADPVERERQDSIAGDRVIKNDETAREERDQPQDGTGADDLSEDSDPIQANTSAEVEPLRSKNPVKPLKGNKHKFRCSGCGRSFVSFAGSPVPTLCKETYCEVEKRHEMEAKHKPKPKGNSYYLAMKTSGSKDK